MKPQQRIFVQLTQSVFTGAGGSRFFRITPTALFNRYTSFLRQVEQSFAKFQVLLLLHKDENVSAFVTTEAVPRLRLGKHVKRGSSLVMEGAESLQRLSRFLERN